jgi:hypothetical protein
MLLSQFLRFWQFAAKIGVFLKNQCCDQLFTYFSFVLRQKRQFFANLRQFFIIKTSVPNFFEYLGCLNVTWQPRRSHLATALIFGLINAPIRHLSAHCCAAHTR